MTVLPTPPWGDPRASYAGDQPMFRDVTNPVPTTPQVPQNLLRVTRRGCDDCPTAEEMGIMSSYGGLAGLGRGGHGGGHHGGHHGGGGRHGRGGGFIPMGYYGGDYGGDTYTVVNLNPCPDGHVWDPTTMRCLPTRPMGVRGVDGGSLGNSLRTAGALAAGAYRGAVGRVVETPSRVGAALRAHITHQALSGLRGLGDSSTTPAGQCADAGFDQAEAYVQAFSIVGQSTANIYGQASGNTGTAADAARVAAGIASGATALTAALQAICQGQQGGGKAPSSTYDSSTNDLLARMGDNASQNSPTTMPSPQIDVNAKAPATDTSLVEKQTMSTGTKVAIGAGALGVIGLAIWFLK